MPITLNGTTGEVFPSWTTAGRPASPVAGQTGFNTTLGVLETWNGSLWIYTGRVLLGSNTVSGAASLPLTGWYSTFYDIYEVEFFDVIPSTNNVTLYMNVSTNGGSTYDTAANYRTAQSYAYITGSTSSGATATDTGVTFGAAHSTNANHTCVGSAKLFNPGGTTLYKSITGHNLYYASSTFNTMLQMYCSGEWQNTAAYNAVRLIFSSGNISGTARIYGLAKG